MRETLEGLQHRAALGLDTENARELVAYARRHGLGLEEVEGAALHLVMSGELEPVIDLIDKQSAGFICKLCDGTRIYHKTLRESRAYLMSDPELVKALQENYARANSGHEIDFITGIVTDPYSLSGLDLDQKIGFRCECPPQPVHVHLNVLRAITQEINKRRTASNQQRLMVHRMTRWWFGLLCIWAQSAWWPWFIRASSALDGWATNPYRIDAHPETWIVYGASHPGGPGIEVYQRDAVIVREWLDHCPPLPIVPRCMCVNSSGVLTGQCPLIVEQLDKHKGRSAFHDEDCLLCNGSGMCPRCQGGQDVR